MRKLKTIIIIIMLFFCLFFTTYAETKKLKLNDKTIVLDAGHGGKDVGSMYKDIYEKDINLNIVITLKTELEKQGANVILTREGDYDLSKPNATRRKKSDFDNRIILINNSKADLYLSIHLNYFNDSKYSGAQIFYNNNYSKNKLLAFKLQEKLNNKRTAKYLDDKLYMYNKLKKPGVLIECGFLSNYNDRNNLQNSDYLKKLSKNITTALIEFYHS